MSTRTSTNADASASTSSAPERPAAEAPWWYTRWFVGVLVGGALLRLALVLFTPGTLDVVVWERHAATLNERGLISYYLGGTYTFNHPPPIAWLLERLWALGQSTGIPFRVLLRLPFALLDAGSLWLILQLLSGQRQRLSIAAVFWLHPLALIYSSYHGNTDSSVAFFLLASALAVSRGNAGTAGVWLGLGLWIKLPGLLAAPALCLALAGWSARLRFAAAAGGAALLGSLLALIENPAAVIEGVVLYSGLSIHTQSGIAAWGLQNLLPAPLSLPAAWRLGYIDFLQFLLDRNTLVCVTPIVVLAWCRRGMSHPREIAWTIAGSYALLYGLTSYWAFQYFAWSLPFWLLVGWRFGLLASLVSTAYVYGLYAWLCGDPLLLGDWDFLGKPDWPATMLWLRDIANVFFLVAGVGALAGALRGEAKRALDATRDATPS